VTPRIKLEIVTKDGSSMIELDKNPNQDQVSIATACMLLLGGVVTDGPELRLLVRLISDAAERLGMRKFPV
jgi:hypothetical protein